MSDFGTTITATKDNDESFTTLDVENIYNYLQNLIDSDDYSTVLQEPFQNEISLDEGDKSLICRLSVHYYGESNEDIFDFVRNSELEDAEEICNKLNSEFPSIEFTANVEEW